MIFTWSLPQGETARRLVGGLAGQLVRIGVGRRVDIGDGTDRARR